MRPILPGIPARLHQRPSLSLRTQLVLWYVALMTLVLVAFSTLLYLSLARNLEMEMDDVLTLAAEHLEATVEVGNGRVRLSENRGEIPSFVLVAFYDSTGKHQLEGTPPSPLLALAEEVRDRAAQGQPGFATLRADDGDGWRVFAEPLRQDGRIVAVMEIASSEHELEVALKQLLLVMAIAVPATLVLATGGGLFMARRALLPIDRITRTARRIGAEDLSQRLGMPPRNDEVGRLAATFDDMLGRLDGAFQRQREFIADASHELRTPLAVITSQIDVALERPRTVAKYQEVLRLMRVEASRMGELVSELLTLAGADSGKDMLEREPVSLDELAHVVAGMLAPVAGGRELRLETGRMEPVVVMGDQARLVQLLLNLVENAIRYTPPGGRITVEVGRHDGEATLGVTDTGIGIAAEHLPHLFERFYRVDEARSRTEGSAGLGLAIVDWIARAHGGRVQVESTPGQGSTFTVYLPLATRVKRQVDPLTRRV